MKEKILRVLFTAVYFVVFLLLIGLVFRNTLNAFRDLLAVICWLIALIVSIGLADYTVKKLKKGILPKNKKGGRSVVL